MRTFLLSLTLILFMVGNLSAQDFKIKNKIPRCYTDECMINQRKLDPTIMTTDQFENWLQPLVAQYRKTKSSLGMNNVLPVLNYKVALVFHIIHNGDAEGSGLNLAQSLIEQEVLQLNKDYANLANSPYAVSAAAGIQFGLATKDPNGNVLTEPGIDRVDASVKGWTAPPYDASSSTSYFWTTIKAGTIWDPTKYVNVWVSNVGDATLTTPLLGIATMPTASTLTGLSAGETATNCGVVVDYTSVGSVYSTNPNGLNTASQCGSNAYSMGKTLTHELGHFFGLRHIWGDGTSTTTCATDYVADTPPSLVANYGTPKHPKTNVCGTPDEMFENYMDYSDDHILNTFTALQVDRIQTVMLHSPRRITLNNAVPMVDVAGSNSIAFLECSGVITTVETGTTGTYPRYHDLSIMLNIEKAASDNSSVLTVTGSGTAVDGIDYQIMNPNISFATGDAYKAIQLRIFDNAVVDGTRNITLSYTISGTGIVAGSNAQTVNVNILDDDNIKIGQNRISLINQDFGTTGGALPTGWAAAASATPYANSFVVGNVTSAGMTGQYAYVTNNKTTKPNTYTKGTAGICVLEFLVNGLSVVSLDTFSFKYKIGGLASNDYGYMVYYNYDDTFNVWNLFGATGGNTGYGPYAKVTTATTAKIIPSEDMQHARTVGLFYFRTGTTTTGTNPGFNIDDVVYRATPYKVETTLSSSYAYDAPALSYNVFKSTNNKAMLIFKNGPSAIPALKATISDAGTTQATVTTAGGTFNRAKKVFKLSQTSVDNSSLDSIILYYTASELAVWGVNNIPNLKVLQAFDGVDIYSTLNVTNSVILTPTVDSSRKVSDSVYTFKVFTKGLGSFMIVDPATNLPLKMLTFKGALKENAVHLDWTTANEYNTGGFEVERSTDGEIYTALGWVNSLGSAALNSYTYTDNSVVKGNKYYYRLKQVDKDGKFVYSSIVIVAYLSDKNWVNVYPNPVKDNLFIQRQNGSYSNTSIVITDVSGKVVFQNNSTLSTTLKVETANWSNGVYIIKLNSNEGSSTMKIVKE